MKAWAVYFGSVTVLLAWGAVLLYNTLSRVLG